MFKKLDLSLYPGITFGPITIIHTDAAGNPVSVVGWQAFAEVRAQAGGELILNLKPTIDAEAGDGAITIPEIPLSDTKELPPGYYKWDLILQNSSAKRLSPTAGGLFTIRDTITDAKSLPNPNT